MVQSFLQIYRIYFNKTFFLIVRKESLQIFLAILCILDLIIDQIDIVGAYLESLLTNNDLSIFMKLVLEIELFRSIREGLVACLL